MSDPGSDFILVRGERYLAIEMVAQWYRVDVAFLVEAGELELLELEPGADQRRLLAEHELDRLAQLLRWHWLTGLELEALALLVPRERRRDG
jgi:hypothetical protein